MARVTVPLTRSSLLEAQRLLELAREGYDLLDRKREILLAELLSAAPEAERARDDMVKAFGAAYSALAAARMAMGIDAVRRAVLAVCDRVPIKVTERSNMGAVVPTIQCSVQRGRPAYSLAGTAVELDRAAEAFRGLLGIVCDAAEKETTALRLAREARGTQRRVNALRNVVIPQQEQIIKQVKEALEDAEREAFFRVKMLKRRK